MSHDYTSIGFYTFDCVGWPVTSIPPGGDTYLIEDLTLAVSGAAGTAVIAAAKMGLDCVAVGGVGDDLMGDWVLERVASFGVDTSLLKPIRGARTSSSIVTTRPGGARPALHLRGATADFLVDEPEANKVVDAKVVHFGGVGLMDAMDGPRNAALIRRAKENGCITTVDVFAGSPNDLPDVEAVMEWTDYFIPSIEEARALSGLSCLEDLAGFFLDKGAQCCIITLGEEGVYLHHTDGLRLKMPAYDVDVRCTCGCGDAFNAGLAVALCRGMELETALRFSQATSALNATGLGSQAGVRTYEDTLRFMESTPFRA